MRTFAIVLVCLAWVLSCFDAVSYFRAGEQQHVLESRLGSAMSQAARTESFAGQDSDGIALRLKGDGEAVASDQLSLDRARKRGLTDAQDQQALAADQAALQADRMMQYTVENFARLEPDPQILVAEKKVDTNGRLLADAIATQARDRTLSHVLVALWVLAAGTAGLAYRGLRSEELRADTEQDYELESESGLATAEDADG